MCTWCEDPPLLSLWVPAYQLRGQERCSYGQKKGKQGTPAAFASEDSIALATTATHRTSTVLATEDPSCRLHPLNLSRWSCMDSVPMCRPRKETLQPTQPVSSSHIPVKFFPHKSQWDKTAGCNCSFKCTDITIKPSETWKQGNMTPKKEQSISVITYQKWKSGNYFKKDSEWWV